MTDIPCIARAELTSWSGNVRKANVTDGIDELAASITAHALLQSIVVRKGICSQRNSRASSQAGGFAERAGMPSPPLAEREQDWLETEAEHGNLVFDPLRRVRRRCSNEQPMRLHFAQLFDEHLLAHVGYQACQIG